MTCNTETAEYIWGNSETVMPLHNESADMSAQDIDAIN